jgi:tRNA 2-thiouridine synthesizing protein E
MYQGASEGQSIAFSPKGFLASFDAWDEEVAEQLAKEDGLELKECHWTAIRFIRDFYLKFEVPPSPRVLIRDVGDKLLGVRCTYRTLKELFPKGGCRQACRLAGLPDYYCPSC